MMQEGISSIDGLAGYTSLDAEALDRVVQKYPMFINGFYFDLMIKRGEALYKQAVPDILELEDHAGFVDPLAEEENSPVKNLTHRYPDRVLFLVSSSCPIFCRFCTRKRRLGIAGAINDKTIEDGLHYIRDHPEVRDVLLSGGDPLLLSDDIIEWLLASLREIRHVEIIRIGTRVPMALPQRVTKSLVRRIRPFLPLFMNIHCNHPDELSDQSRDACQMLADAGIVLGSQTVLLKGINDNAPVLETLFRTLLHMRVRPYYLLQADMTRSTAHFRTRVEKGVEVMRSLHGRISGLAVPHLVIDLPGGGGKVPLFPLECADSAQER